MMEVPAAAVGERGSLPGKGGARGSSGTDTHSRIHHTQHHSSQDPTDTEISSAPLVPSRSVAVGSSSSSYAFITHSQEGLRKNRPPIIDNAGLARRRRRRTSQHDQAILEKEYRKCDRPDKARRREITALVEMGDKEVQIWFQNKRQSARRKLKPLLPHEIIPNAMKSSSSPAPAYQHHHYHHRAGYTNVRGIEEKREEEECIGQDKDNAEEDESEVWTMRKFLDRTLGLDVDDEVVPHTDPNKVSEGERRGNSRHEGRECKEQEQEAEYLGQGSSQDQLFSSSQSSSQNHGYYSQQETPSRERDDDNDDRCKLPPAAVRRMSMSHMRLQEALSSPLPASPPPPANAATGPLTTPQSTQPQRRYSLVREPPSELSEYIHSDFPQQQQTPIKPLPAPPLALPAPNFRRSTPQGTYRPPILQKRSSSFLRLSTSLDGHAEVVIDTEPTLPPPLPHDLITPRRSAPMPYTSSALRDIDNTRSSRVWEFYCDKQQQTYLSSDGAVPNHHHHHSALEPDEAGMALSIARSRRRVGALKYARRKLVFGDVALMRGDSGIGGMINSPKVQRRGSVYDDDGPFGSGKKVEVTKETLLGKKRISLGEVGSSNSSKAKPSTYPSTSTCRKPAYREVEIYEQPSSSQTTAPLSPSSQGRVLPTPVPGGKRKNLSSPPRGGRGGGGGEEDYYIFGHESDKENHRDDGEKVVFAESVNVKQQRPVKALKKSLDTKDRGWRSGEKASPASGVVKKNKVKVNIVGGDVGGRGEGRGDDEKRVRKKQRVLGEVAAGQGQVQKLGGMVKEGTKQGRVVREVDVDFGGAELLLSLSAGRWGC
ncbi:hypothetical protein EV426DRAFT_352320 [Tirmania nivea]|nr:hypothetical protein EV426DRAFT_352320 [Tirmania nivea]